jgi:enoyl-CoA hydratase/carnithine racemase
VTIESEEPSVRVARQGPVVIVTLNRPDAINAINDTIRMELAQALRAADDEEAVRAVVINGSGPRGFCVGADIKEMRRGESAVVAHDRLRRAELFPTLARMQKPTIAAIHGYCLGGGFEIALACDIRIASHDALFALPETGLGLIPGGGGTQRLPRLIGAGRALDLVLSGDRIDAHEAFRIGVVSRLCKTHEALAQDALDLALRIAARSPRASRYAKRATLGGIDLPLEAGLSMERDLFTMLMSTADHVEATNAFHEKRVPVFKES